MRLESDYTKKTTKVSNESAATVITGATAVNGVQTLKINQLAKTGYLTGGELKDAEGKKADYKSSTKLTEMGIEEGSKITLKANGKTTDITVNGDMTIDQFVSKLKDAGLNASFDSKNQRFFISAQKSGADNDFSLTAANDSGEDALNTLCLATPLDQDYQARQEYLKYCNQVIDNAGRVTYIAKSSAELESMVDERVQERLLTHIENQEALAKVEEEIAKFDSDLPTKEVIENRTEELKRRQETLNNKVDKTQEEADELKEIEEELETLETQKTDRAKLDELNAEKAKLDEALAVDEGYFELVDGTYQLSGDKLKTQLASDASKAAKLAEEKLNDTTSTTGATRIAGQDAVVTLNGAVFTSDSNNFEINGLTITANAETENEITLTTTDDTDGIYDMIKNFLKEYNELINEMDKLYNAESAKGYEPLTDEEKEAMSEKEVEKWEEKIKNSLLRRDSTLNSVATAMKQVMMQGVKMEDGSQLYLSEFGIGTLGYFSSKDNEKNAYHIDGDPDDANTMTNADKLKTAIANDPDKVVEFFQKLSKELYEKLGSMMKKTEYSSSFTLYDDIAMKNEYNDYTSKISKQEQKITDYEDRYYKKFSAMETALAKLQSKESAVSGLFNI